MINLQPCQDCFKVVNGTEAFTAQKVFFVPWQCTEPQDIKQGKIRDIDPADSKICIDQIFDDKSIETIDAIVLPCQIIDELLPNLNGTEKNNPKKHDSSVREAYRGTKSALPWTSRVMRVVDPEIR